MASTKAPRGWAQLTFNGDTLFVRLSDIVAVRDDSHGCWLWLRNGSGAGVSESTDNVLAIIEAAARAAGDAA